MSKVKNFARFYALLKMMPGEASEMKEEIISSFTEGRTISLRDMEDKEFDQMCDFMQKGEKGDIAAIDSAKKKKLRHAVLENMADYGLDTSNWEAIDNLCLNPRIAGKKFNHLSVDELKALIPKLKRIIAKKREQPIKKTEAVMPITSYLIIKQQTVYS